MPERGLPSLLSARPDALRELAPTLGLHAADLFVMAGVAVPADLTPVDPRAGGSAAWLAKLVIGLAPDRRRELSRLVASLPQEARPPSPPDVSVHEQYPAGPGALLMRLAGNRNLGLTATAQAFLSVTGRYWSAATYGMVGRGRKPLTPDLLLDFSTLLGIPPADLSALTGAPSPTTALSPARPQPTRPS